MNDGQRTIESGATASSYPDWDVESVVDQVWTDLGGTVNRPAIRQELAEVIPAFKDARITTYVPLFVRKRTAERLRAGLSGVTSEVHARAARSAVEPTDCEGDRSIVRRNGGRPHRWAARPVFAPPNDTTAGRAVRALAAEAIPPT